MPQSIPPVLPKALTERVARIAQVQEVERIILFGSRARGDAQSRSDIDLAISAPTMTRRRWLEIVDLMEEAESLLSIDLVRLDEAGEGLQAQIRKEGKVLYERSESDSGTGKS